MTEVENTSSGQAVALPTEPADQERFLADHVARILEQAAERGAEAAEVGASAHQALSVTVRLGEVESLEYSRDSGLGITVYFGNRKGSASSADLSEASIATSLDMACEIARFTEPDECNGLADPDRMATEFPDLDLWHPQDLDAERAIEIARDMEAAALEHHGLIRNSEGGSLSTGFAVSAYGNSHGFLTHRRSTRHSLSCVVIAQDDDDMQRDYWYDTRRSWSDLMDPEAIGRRAAERAVRRHGAMPVPTGRFPVLFAPEAARSLLGHLVSAVSGSNLYRKSSFLLDRLGEPLFPEFVTIGERPLEPRGLRSAHCDSEGVATAERDIVDGGVLAGYVLGSYAARRLGMASTGNAGGTHNLTLEPGPDGFDELVSRMGRGLLVTEMMGQGVNIVTGDYSRGASGFWIDNGLIDRPVEGVTVAGNLRDVFAGITAVGSDLDTRSGTRCGSILVGEMTVGGE